MEHACTLPVIRPEAMPARVEVSVDLPVSEREAWRALTRPEQVSCWFGDLDATGSGSSEPRLDFRDGDYFTLQPLLVSPPHHLSYRWRFLGIGPPATVDWHVVPTQGGCSVIVRDTDPHRSPNEADALGGGWLDFMGRLSRFVVGGENSRYALRHTLDGNIELSAEPEAAWITLFTGGRIPQWLPLEGETLSPGIHLHFSPALAARVSSVAESPPRGVQFQLQYESWMKPMECELSLTPRRNGSLLTFRQSGGDAFCLCGGCLAPRRRRFVEFWRAALIRAQEVVR